MEELEGAEQLTAPALSAMLVSCREPSSSVLPHAGSQGGHRAAGSKPALSPTSFSNLVDLEAGLRMRGPPHPFERKGWPVRGQSSELALDG
jgi:hypothetical protein